MNFKASVVLSSILFVTMNRRIFIKNSCLASSGLIMVNSIGRASTISNVSTEPVFNKTVFKDPIIIESLDLLKIDNNWFIRVRSKEGAEGWAMSNNALIPSYFAIFIRDVAPFFIGKDAREIEDLVEGAFLNPSKYKNQGQSLWLCIASAEFAILDMLGRIADRPVGELLGGIRRKQIPIYIANNHRRYDWQESLKRIIRSVEEIDAQAVKFKIGGRMKLIDTYPGRTEKLIVEVAKALGDRCTLYADSNGSYVDPAYAIKIGRMLEANGYAMYEEPCPFDDLFGLKKVADALDITIAGGEQESSEYRFRWMIENGAIQLSQPDHFNYGGLIRTLKIARLSEQVGIPCISHIARAGMGFLYMLVFSSCAPALGPFQEYKGVNRTIPWESPGVDFKVTDGKVPVPLGPGMGVNYDPEYLAKATLIDASYIP